MGLARACKQAQVHLSPGAGSEFLHTQSDGTAGICYLVQPWPQLRSLRCKVVVPVVTVPLWPWVPLLGISSVESNSRGSQAHLTGLHRVWRHSLVA